MVTRSSHKARDGIPGRPRSGRCVHRQPYRHVLLGFLAGQPFWGASESGAQLGTYS